MKTKNVILLGVVGVAGVGYYLYTKSKSPMPNVSNTTLNNEVNTIAPSPSVTSVPINTYSTQEANTKALVTVKEWIKTYDGLSDDVLNQKSGNQIFLEKQLADLKAIKNPTQKNKDDIKITETNLTFTKLLKDKIIMLKDIEYQKVYNVLKDLYAQYPKADVNKLMVIMPKYLSGFMLGTDYKYSKDNYDTFSIDDKLYLSDINLAGKWLKIYIEKYPIIRSPFGLAGSR